MNRLDNSVEVEPKGARWVSGWVWFMSVLNFLLILTLAAVLWRVLPGEADTRQAIKERDQAIVQRDQAFAHRAQAFDRRYKEMKKQLDQTTKSLNALDSQLTLAQENQKKLGVLLQAQTDAFQGTVQKLEELINARVQ